MTYDRGYALQTKSLLLENTTTAFEAVTQLFEALGLRGSPKDYALEERNVVTGGKKCSLSNVLFVVVVIVVATVFRSQYISCLFVCLLENQIVDGMEIPLNLQLNHGPHQSCMELRIVQLRDTLSVPLKGSSNGRGGGGGGANDSDSDDTGSNPNLSPKEEGRAGYSYPQ